MNSHRFDICHYPDNFTNVFVHFNENGHIASDFSFSQLIKLKLNVVGYTEAPFLDLQISVSNGFASTKINDKRDDFDFDIVNVSFLDGDVPSHPSYGAFISKLIRFARVRSHVTYFNARNKSLTAKLLQQGYQYHKLLKTF